MRKTDSRYSSWLYRAADAVTTVHGSLCKEGVFDKRILCFCDVKEIIEKACGLIAAGACSAEEQGSPVYQRTEVCLVAELGKPHVRRVKGAQEAVGGQ